MKMLGVFYGDPSDTMWTTPNFAFPAYDTCPELSPFVAHSLLDVSPPNPSLVWMSNVKNSSSKLLTPL